MRASPPELPPLLRDQRITDADHLRLLAIFHFVLAGLAGVALLFLLLHFVLFRTLFANPELWKNQPGAPPPEIFISMFQWFYVFFGALVVAVGVLNALSGRFIRQRRRRGFSLVVAGINCLQFPFGTALGVCSFVVLLRDSVREAYGE